MNPDVRRARAAFMRVGVILPLALIVLASILVAFWLPELPDPSAIHWGADGPNGFGPAWTNLAVLLGVGGGTVILLATLGLFAHRMPRNDGREPFLWSPAPRFLGAMNLGVAGLMSTLAVVVVGSQRGLADAADAPDLGIGMLAAFALLIGLTVLGWFLQPKVTVLPPAAGGSAEPLPLGAGERAVWVGTAAMARSAQIVLAMAVFSMLALTAVLFAVGERSWWIAGLVSVLVAALVVSTMTFRVRISAAGLRVHSTAGWPRVDIRAADIRAVRAVRVNPIAEFGGWGYRIGVDGRRGFVLRAGDALEVRTDDRVFVVTLDDAATAASVLASAAAPDHSDHPDRGETP